MTLRALPDPMGEELRALDGALRRLERFQYLPPDPRRERALSAAFTSRASWDALRAAAHASRAAARVLNIATHHALDRPRADAAYCAGELLDAVRRLALAAEQRAHAGC